MHAHTNFPTHLICLLSILFHPFLSLLSSDGGGGVAIAVQVTIRYISYPALTSRRCRAHNFSFFHFFLSPALLSPDGGGGRVAVAVQHCSRGLNHLGCQPQLLFDLVNHGAPTGVDADPVKRELEVRDVRLDLLVEALGAFVRVWTAVSENMVVLAMTRQLHSSVLYWACLSAPQALTVVTLEMRHQSHLHHKAG